AGARVYPARGFDGGGGDDLVGDLRLRALAGEEALPAERAALARVFGVVALRRRFGFLEGGGARGFRRSAFLPDPRAARSAERFEGARGVGAVGEYAWRVGLARAP